MKRFFKYLFILFVFVNYVQAVAEINEGCIVNTYNDDCDTYVDSKGVDLEALTKIKCQADFVSYPELEFNFQSFEKPLFQTLFFYYPEKTFKEKLFLKNCSLLI